MEIRKYFTALTTYINLSLSKQFVKVKSTNQKEKKQSSKIKNKWKQVNLIVY